MFTYQIITRGNNETYTYQIITRGKNVMFIWQIYTRVRMWYLATKSLQEVGM